MASSKGEMGHTTYKDLDADHHSAGAYSGGKCLYGHLSTYTKKDSCSYRWQGIKRAKESPMPYEFQSSGFKQSKDNSMIRTLSSSYAAKLLGAAAGKKITDDNLDSKYKKILPKGYTTGWCPWINSVHHVLPNAVLMNSVIGFAGDYPQIATVIQRGLLGEKYNINFKVNMIILPCVPEVARMVGLPTHARGDNHSTYSREIQGKVSKKLKGVYGSVKNELMNDSKKHVKPKHKKLKTFLEDTISDAYYKKIRAYGLTLQDPSVSAVDMTLDAFSGTL